MDKVVFVLRAASPSGFKFTLAAGELVKFVNKRLEVTEAALIEEIRNLIKTKPGIAQHVREVDPSEALAIVAAHKASIQSNVIKGGATASAVSEMQQSMAAQQKQELADAKVVADLDADNLVILEETNLPPAQKPEPVVPDALASAQAVKPASQSIAPKISLGNLSK